MPLHYWDIPILYTSNPASLVSIAKEDILFVGSGLWTGSDQKPLIKR